MEQIIKSLAEFFTVRIPLYVVDTLRLLSGPKAFLEQETIEDNEKYVKALSFFFISIVLCNALFATYIPDELPLYKTLAVGISYTIVFSLLHVFFILLSWKIVRINPHIQRMVACYCYIMSISMYLQVALGLVLMPIFESKIFEEFANRLPTMTQQEQINLLSTNNDLLSITFWMYGVIIVYMLIDFFWVFITWGAFRKIANASKKKSGVAFFIAYIAGFALMIFSLYSLSGLQE